MRFDPPQLAALSAVLHLGSFDAAAALLGVTPSAVSQRIKALEDRIGTPLVNRTSPCTGTETGLRIAKHAEDVALLEQRLSRDLSLDTTSTPARLKVAVNADSLATWFVEAMVAAGDVLFELVIDDQDHSTEWLRRGEVSAAVTAEARPVAGCDAFALGQLDYVATASPAFMARWFADGLTPEAAGRAPCMIFNTKDRLQHRWLATHVTPDVVPPAHYLSSTQAFLDAATAGLGWGMNPVQLARPYLERGDLVELVPGSTLGTPLYWQVSRIMAPALRDITQAARRAAARTLTPVDA
ncbi:LysR family transcriptional regulator ArgP [Tritonibacter scottomollicae]|uniref:LysR family transcriptional regulator ArgP n=1 Tax=Tritonibacter scottomollicae TaxID=483013 RepID=A0ABZ0HJ28_TRISK|nr:LysR family transcriptional regulator ArgP [Tritonibacter scottomollicae]WOI34679.1 LysR family transcriptional regulator ArgP [Tritonibacter scottomollicae]